MWTYGLALFSLTIISAISLAVLSGYLFEYHISKEAKQRLYNPVDQAAPHIYSSFTLYRFQIGCLLLMALLGTLPDVLVLLAWGEASNDTMWVFFQLDRIGDGLAGMPFIAFALTHAIAKERIAHRLSLDAERVPLSISWLKAKEKVKIVGWSLVIACGVTLYKAGIA